jgi:hypothetical protein
VQVAVVGDGLDAFGVGDYVLIAGHHDHGTELQAFGQLQCCFGAADLGLAAHEDAELPGG